MTPFSRMDLVYSSRRLTAVVPAAIGGIPSATLARVERLLLEASQAFGERRYQDAIDDYTSCRGLVWGELFPSVDLVEPKVRGIDILRPLASCAAEWLNLLPIESALSGARPREEIAFDPGPPLGLRSGNVTAQGAAAAADLQLAAILDVQGNDGAAAFFRGRAERAAPELVKQLGDAALSPAVEGPTTIAIPPGVTVAQRSFTALVAGEAKVVQWSAGAAPGVDDLISTFYAQRVALTQLPDVLIAPTHAADLAAALPHIWYYESPLGLAECYAALGEYATAESWYLQAAAYQYLNAAIEAPYLWGRLASLYLAWGDDLFRRDAPDEALPIYEKVVGLNGDAPSEPATELWKLAGLQPAAETARPVLPALTDGTDPATIAASPAIVGVLFDIWAQISKIRGGLDFWGHWAQQVPIWTFDYLQSVAINFCQLAVGTERDAIGFWEKADAAQLSRTQLLASVTQAQAEKTAADQQVAAAGAELTAYRAGQAAAQLRATNARADADEYAAKSWEWSLHQAQSAQLAGGDDGDAEQLNQLADQFTSGPYSVSGSHATLGAAEQLASSRIQNQYEVDSLNRQADDLDAAAAQAAAETNAASARVQAAAASASAAAVRVSLSQQLVDAFDDQRFTPAVWSQLGQRMSDLSSRYLGMALEIAKLMQRAYNFENDTALAVIKPDYTSDTIRGLLAADVLLADVESFTYDLVTSTAPNPQPIRQTISLAERYPNAFETSFRPTGTLDFDTGFDDFDALYPGTYAGRIEAVEVAVDGIVPASGLTGSLTNAGISHYRLPLGAWPPPPGVGVKHRVQTRETLVLSDYDPRADVLLVEQDRRRRRVFEGAGLASHWTLELPPELNDVDYESILDVRLTFLYQARFDPDLRTRVLGDLAARDALHARVKPLPLRWLFPDAFFAFYASGTLDFTIGAEQFARTEIDPRITGLALLAVTSPGTSPGGLKLDVAAAGHAPVAVTTQADGTVAPADLAPAANGSAFGAYSIGVTAADNPGWVRDGKLALDALANLSLLLSYTYTPRT